MLRNLVFDLLYFCIRPNKGREQQFLLKQLLAEQPSLRKATFEQLFEKLCATFWENSSNLWKALTKGVGRQVLVGSGGPLSKPGIPGIIVFCVVF